MYSFLLIGQSNMAGRGNPEDDPFIKNDRVHILINGRWQKAFFPINRDRHTSGINLSESFADLFAREHDADVGLIPCADGGTNLKQWSPGDLLYDNAINNARLAMRTSTLAGILWHQGEGDCREHFYPLYEEKLNNFIKSIRKDLNAENVPFLMGGLGDFLKDCPISDYLVNYVHINKALKTVAEKNHMTGFVSAEGLTSNSDLLHFDAKSLHTFGERYYRVYKSLEDKIKLVDAPASEETTKRTSMELL